MTFSKFAVVGVVASLIAGCAMGEKAPRTVSTQDQAHICTNMLRIYPTAMRVPVSVDRHVVLTCQADSTSLGELDMPYKIMGDVTWWASNEADQAQREILPDDGSGEY